MRNDLIYALRGMARNRGLTAVALLTLSLGIGATTSMFSVLHAVLLRPLPYREPERLVAIWARIPRMKIDGAFVEYNTFTDWWRPRTRSFEALTAYSPALVNLTSVDPPQRVRTARVSAAHLKVIGLRPALGRDFLPEEDKPGAPRVCLLGHALWTARFGGARDVLGRQLTLDGAGCTVIGVLPPEYEIGPEEILLPLAHSGARAPGMPTVGVYGRLKPGATLEQAQAEIDELCRGWVAQYRYPKDWGARVWRVRDFTVRDVRASVLVLSAAVGMVLLIACANVANLLLARAGARSREMAIRVAIGAGRGRIVRQLLVESATLGAAAAAIGLALAYAGVRVLAAADVRVPFLAKARVDAPVLAFTVAAALVTTLLFGLAPALAAARPNLTEGLKEGSQGAGESRRRNRLRAALVVAEVALALLLAVGAALTTRGLARLLDVHPGFDPEGLLTASVNLPRAAYPEPARRVAFFNQLRDRVAAAPGVQSAGMVSGTPFSGSRSGSDVIAEGAPPPRPGEQRIAFARVCDPQYFRTLRVPLRGGRWFTPSDGPKPEIAIVNETFARRFFPGADAVGKRFALGRAGAPQQVWYTVVGVAGDIRNTGLADEPDAEFYFPYAQNPGGSLSLVVRSSAAPAAIAGAVRAAVRELNAGLPASEVVPLSETIAKSTASRRFSVTLLAVFAVLALLLAAVGIYGVVSYTVARRTQEIGIRMALGAGRARIAAMVVGRAIALTALGVALGLAAGLALTRLLGSLLYGVSATDPAVFAGAAAFLFAVAALAAYLPARRAARVDPLTALRHE